MFVLSSRKEFLRKLKNNKPLDLSVRLHSLNLIHKDITAIDFPEYVFQKQSPRGVPGKGVLRTFSKFTEKHPCGNVISIKLQSIGVLL